MTDDAFGLSTLGQILIPVTDMERSTAFYRDQFGMRFLYAFPGIAFFDADGVRIYLAQPEAADFGGRAALLQGRGHPRGGDHPRERAGSRSPVHRTWSTAIHSTPKLLDGLHEGSRRQQHRADVRGPDRGLTTRDRSGDLPRGAPRGDLGPTALEERPLGLVRGLREGGAVGFGGLAPAPQSAQEVGPGRVEVPVLGHRRVRAQRVDRREAGRGRRTWAKATARLRSTTGEGATRWSTSYRPRICGQSVAPESRRLVVDRGDDRLELVRTHPAHPQRPVHDRPALGDLGCRPQPAVLVLEPDETRAEACRAGHQGVGEQHQRQEPQRLGLRGHEVREDPREADRLRAGPADQGLAGARRSPR